MLVTAKHFAPAALLVLAGCRSCPAPPQPADPAALEALRGQSEAEAARHRALAEGRAAAEKDLAQTYPELWSGLRIGTRVPEGASLEALRQALDAHAGSVGLSLSAYEAAVATDPAGAAPLLREIRVTFQLAPSDLGRLERWFLTRAEADRLFHVDEVRLGAKAATVRLTAFAFVPHPPHVALEPFDPAALLAGAGIPPGTPSAQALRAAYEALNAGLPEANAALEARTRAGRLEARYRSFTETAKRIETQRWLDVLR